MLRLALIGLLSFLFASNELLFAQKKAYRHPLSAVFWVSAALARNDQIEVHWGGRGGGVFTGTVTDVTGNVATVQITGVITAGIGPTVGQKIVIAPADSICSSCTSSNCSTAATNSFPVDRTIVLGPGTTDITMPTNVFFGTAFNYQSLSLPAGGQLSLRVGTPGTNGIAPVSILDISQMPLPQFNLLGLNFARFGAQIVHTDLSLDTSTNVDNLFGSVRLRHTFRVNGLAWSMENLAAIRGSWDLPTGNIPRLHAMAGFSAPQQQAGGPSSAAPVVVNEFLYDDSSTDDKEFVELYNRSNAPVDISGWVIFADDPTTTNASYTIPGAPLSGTTILNPGAYWVVGTALVPNVNQIVGTVNLWENDNESLELRDDIGNVIDSVAYEIARGTWGPHPREGAGLTGEIVSVDAAPNTWQRNHDGHDTDDNGCDFCIMAWTPGAANGSANPLPLGYANTFDAPPGTSLLSEFNYAFVPALVQDPAAFVNSGTNVISLPPSPQGGNIATFHDTTGGGNAHYMKVQAGSHFLLETWVYVRGGNAAFAAPGATGEGEAWAIGVTGTTNGAAHPPNVNGYHAAIQCTGMFPGATGIGWFAYVQQAQTSIYLVDMNNGGAGFNVLAGPIVATPGLNDGWQRLRLRIDDGNLVANFGGTYGCDDGQRFTASGVGNCGGTIYFQYRECILSNLLMTPLAIDRLEVYGVVSGSVATSGFGTPTSAGIPQIGTAGGSPVIGNLGFQITGASLMPSFISALLLTLGYLDPGVPVPGAQPNAYVYVAPILSTNLLFSTPTGTASLSLGIPCDHAILGLPIAGQILDLDFSLPFAVPVGTSLGIQILVGN
jgi:hypothetical protein